LTNTSLQYTLDRILLTRILDPAFEQCDVFLPDFQQEGVWKEAEHRELVDWAGFDVPEGIQEEKGVKYVYQMWVRENNETS